MEQTIPTDTPSIFDVLDSLSTLRKQAIVRPDNPPPGIAGFLFNIPEEDEIALRATITDNFVEQNFAISDGIALLPEEYTVRGLVAELVRFTPTAQPVAVPTNPLPLNPNLTPELTPGAVQAQADLAAVRVDEDASVAGQDSLWNYFTARNAAPPATTNQARAFAYFYALFRARELFTVETPWGVLRNVAIQNLRAAQGDASKFESSFTITFKIVRTAEAVTVTAGTLAGRAAQQSADTTQNGVAGKTPLSEDDRQSLLYRFLRNP
jgi:hypothetical protein